MTQCCKLQTANAEDTCASEMPKPDRHGRYMADSGIRMVTPRVRREDPLMLALQQSAFVIAMEARLGGPKAVGSSLGERCSLPELPDAQVALALRHMEAMRSIREKDARRCIALLAMMRGARPRHTLRSAAVEMDAHVSRVVRLKARGLEEVARFFERDENIIVL